MKLTKAQIRRYRSIEELDEFRIEPDVTCLVGKNESGKTATLQALFKSRAIDSASFDDSLDFPSHRTRELAGGKKVVATVLTYKLDDDDVAAVSAHLGADGLSSRTISVTTGYRYRPEWTVQVDEPAVVKHLRGEIELPASTAASADKARTVADLLAVLQEMEGPTPATTEVVETITSWRESKPTLKAIDVLNARRPKFVYFGDYDVMPGKGLLQDRLTLHLRDEVLLEGCRCAQEVPT